MKGILSNIQCHTFFLIRKWSIQATTALLDTTSVQCYVCTDKFNALFKRKLSGYRTLSRALYMSVSLARLEIVCRVRESIYGSSITGNKILSHHDWTTRADSSPLVTDVVKVLIDLLESYLVLSIKHVLVPFQAKLFLRRKVNAK